MRSQKGWVKKLDDTHWAYRTAFKTPIWTTLFRLVYGKPCHFSIEPEHRAYWTIKHLNFDLKSMEECRLLQLNEHEKIRLDAYESSRIYKERMKQWHNKFINRCEFQKGDLVFLFNSYLKLFSSKFHSRWLCTFKVLKVYPYGAIEISTEATGSFKVNGSRLKHYIVDESLERKVTYALLDVSSS